MRAQVQGMWRDHAGAWHAQKHSAGVGRAVQEQEEGGGGMRTRSTGGHPT